MNTKHRFRSLSASGRQLEEKLHEIGIMLIAVGIVIGIFQYFTLPFLMKDVGIPSPEQFASWFLIPALFLLTGIGLLTKKVLSLVVALATRYCRKD